MPTSMKFSHRISTPPFTYFFFFNDTATTEIYTLSLHDALPISCSELGSRTGADYAAGLCCSSIPIDRKSTRLNSSHDQISYAVFCLKKKKYYDPLHVPDVNGALGTALTVLARRRGTASI